MGKFLKHFRILFIVVGLITVVSLFIFFTNRPTGIRTNSAWDGETKVFDFADKLSAEDEATLTKHLTELQKEYMVDLAVVILNENLANHVNYVNDIGYQASSVQEQTMIFADDCMDVLQMGYNEPHGDAALLVDNWSREADGYLYYWISTTGRLVNKPSSSAISQMADKRLGVLHDDSSSQEVLSAYTNLMTDIAKAGSYNYPYGVMLPVIVGAIAGLIYFLVNKKGSAGKVTVTDSTYLDSGDAHFTRTSDRFINRTVTKTPRPKETRSGGGGGHRSSGGVSHGGGGGRR